MGLYKHPNPPSDCDYCNKPIIGAEGEEWLWISHWPHERVAHIKCYESADATEGEVPAD